MGKLVVAYRHPTDTEEFELRCQGEHVEMARRIPHLSGIEFGKVAGLMAGPPAPYHRIAELYFAVRPLWAKPEAARRARRRSPTPVRSRSGPRRHGRSGRRGPVPFLTRPEEDLELHGGVDK